MQETTWLQWWSHCPGCDKGGQGLATWAGGWLHRMSQHMNYFARHHVASSFLHHTIWHGFFYFPAVWFLWGNFPNFAFHNVKFQSGKCGRRSRTIFNQCSMESAELLHAHLEIQLQKRSNYLTSPFRPHTSRWLQKVLASLSHPNVVEFYSSFQQARLLVTPCWYLLVMMLLKFVVAPFLLITLLKFAALRGLPWFHRHGILLWSLGHIQHDVQRVHDGASKQNPGGGQLR